LLLKDLHFNFRVLLEIRSQEARGQKLERQRLKMNNLNFGSAGP